MMNTKKLYAGDALRNRWTSSLIAIREFAGRDAVKSFGMAVGYALLLGMFYLLMILLAVSQLHVK